MITSEGEVHGKGQKYAIAKDVITAMADQALRTIALAYREFPQGGGGGGGAFKKIAYLCLCRRPKYGDASAWGSCC